MAVIASVPVSVVLQQLHDDAPARELTLGWPMGRLSKRLFGIVILLLGLVAIAPGVSVIAGLLLLIPARQLILGHAAPAFPHRIANVSGAVWETVRETECIGRIL
jgi:hypothetical protein